LNPLQRISWSYRVPLEFKEEPPEGGYSDRLIA